MTRIDLEKLRRLAENSLPEDWYKQGYMELENICLNDRLFIETCSPEKIIAIIDELEELRNEKGVIK